MNLLDEPWIPVRTTRGAKARIAPWQLTQGHDGADPIVAVDALRADFTGALFQFLTALLQNALAPEEDADWRTLFEQAPTADELRERLAPLRHAFVLDGAGPRFMQDIDDLGAEEPKDISTLLIEAPGGNTQRNNLDLFVKRSQVGGLCPACAAAALFTLQTNAPSGGAGHRTSLRGGGPLTTVVLCDGRAEGNGVPETLWRNLWLNVLDRATFEQRADARRQADGDRFPWLAPTRTSDRRGGATLPEDVHPLQVYWAMPRRIRLDFTTTTAGTCDICGAHHETLLTRYRTKNYGTDYKGAWRHPLAPYALDKECRRLPLHPQPGGIGYRHWRGLVVPMGREREPAEVVRAWYTRQMPEARFRLWAFGYDMDNMKARCWYETTMPLYPVPPQRLEEYGRAIVRLVNAAEYVAGLLVMAVKSAWFKWPADIPGDVSFVEAAFWNAAEADFQATAALLAQGAEEGPQRGHWRHVLVQAAEQVFDHYALSAPVGGLNIRRVVEARRCLQRNLAGAKFLRLLDLKPPRKAMETV